MSSNFVNIMQEQWEELTNTLHTASQQAELWVKEREGLASMLGAAKEALTAAQNDAQAVDQRSRELMGLYGWARVSGGSGTGGGTKVEIFLLHVLHLPWYSFSFSFLCYSSPLFS